MRNKITIDIDKEWGTVDQSAFAKKLRTVDCWCPVISNEWIESPNHRIHVDVELDMSEYVSEDEIDAMLMMVRMYLGDDGRRCRSDIQRYFEGGQIRHILRHRRDIPVEALI